MGIRDRKMNVTDKSTWKVITCPLGSISSSQTATVFDEIVPTLNGVVTAVEFFCSAATNLTSVDVQIGTHSATATCLNAAITPTAGTAVEGVLLSTTPYELKSCMFGPDGNGAGTTIHAVYTSGSGASVTGGILRIWVRPRPLNGEVI